jgi:hypothetical protein
MSLMMMRLIWLIVFVLAICLSVILLRLLNSKALMNMHSS